jgi:catechol 2,3-dioxygenase-like lactoylglutathione lyase family enzyme
MPILRLNHAQVSIPVGAEDQARAFYCHLLGLREIPKPDSLAGRGGLWLQVGDMQIHLGVEDGVDHAATLAHLAYEVEVELVPVLGREYWGQGYATEAGRALLAYGFGELRIARVLSPIRASNARSIALARRLGCVIRRNLHPGPGRYNPDPQVYAVMDRATWAAARRAASHGGAGRSETPPCAS